MKYLQVILKLFPHFRDQCLRPAYNFQTNKKYFYVRKIVELYLSTQLARSRSMQFTYNEYKSSAVTWI